GALLVLLLLVGSTSPFLQAQQMTADVLGTVLDPTGATMAGAKVTVRGLATGEVRTATSNDRGDFTFNLLPIGHYSLKVEAAGFKAYEVPDFEIHVGDRARFNVPMAVGVVTETIETTAEAAFMQTEESSVGGTLESKTVQDLPINGRNFMEMVQLTAGVQGSTTHANYSYLAGGGVEDRRTG